MVRQGTYLVVRQGTYLVVREGTYLVVREGTYLIVRQGTYLVVRKGTYLVVRQGTYLVVRQGTYLVVRQRTYLVVREGGSTSRQDDGREVEGDQQKVTLRHFRVLHPEALLEVLEYEGDEDVESLAHALEHDEAQRDARDGVEHAEDLAAHRLRGTVAVTFEEEKQRARYNLLFLRFFVYIIQTHKRFKRTVFIGTKQNMLK